MEKLTKKEFINIFKTWKNKNINFNTFNLSIKSVNDTLESVDNISFYKISDNWNIKEDLQIKEYSKFLELNGSRLELEGKFYFDNDKNILINEYIDNNCILYVNKLN